MSIESLHRTITSPNPGSIDALVGSVRRAMDDTTDAIDLIQFAADKPNWSSPSARTRFNIRAWATRAAAEVTFIRLNRASLASQRLRETFAITMPNADIVLANWQRFLATGPNVLALAITRWQTLALLNSIKKDAEDAIAEAIAFLQENPLTDEQREWLDNGLLKSLRHDLNNPGQHGPIIPGTFATGDPDGGFTPQGLGMDENGNLLQTSYNHDGQAQLDVIDPTTGEVINTVQLSGGDTSAPNHAGGVAVHDGSIWVMSSDKPPRMYQYDANQVAQAPPGSSVDPVGDPMTVRAGAYSTVDGDTLYVGTFEEESEGRLYTYQWEHGQWVESGGPYVAPPRAQGITVRDGDVVFSTSSGRGNAGELRSYRLGDVLGSRPADPSGHHSTGVPLPDPTGTVEVPNMAEGLVAGPNGLVTTYESGSSEYSEASKSASLDDLWASMNMTVTPYSDLGLSGEGELDVDPPSLRVASDLFSQAETSMNAVEKSVAGIDVGSAACGTLSGSAEFASVATTFFDETSEWIGEGRLSASTTASGLIATAGGYVDTDYLNEQRMMLMKTRIS